MQSYNFIPKVTSLSAKQQSCENSIYISAGVSAIIVIVGTILNLLIWKRKHRKYQHFHVRVSILTNVFCNICNAKIYRKKKIISSDILYYLKKNHFPTLKSTLFKEDINNLSIYSKFSAYFSINLYQLI